MQRLKDYCGVVAWQTGSGYLMLWALTYWALADGAAVFGQSGVCRADSAQVLFYWACDPASPLEILAGVVNFALTITVWAPVFVAAATVDPNAAIIAAPIVALHVVGLPLGILALVRLLARTCDALRQLRCRIRGPATAVADSAPAADRAPAAAMAATTHRRTYRNPVAGSRRA